MRNRKTDHAVTTGPAAWAGLILLAACPVWAVDPAGVVPIAMARELGKGVEPSADRISVVGRVTFRPGSKPGDPRFFYIQDATGGIAVVPKERMSLRLGEELRVAGRVRLFNDLEPEVIADLVYPTGGSGEVTAQDINLAEARSGARAGSLVAVVGTVASIRIGEDWAVAVLNGGESQIRIQLRNPQADADRLEDLCKKGARVRAQGILVPLPDGTYQVRMRRFEDLGLLQPAPLDLPFGLQIAMLIAGISAAACGLWIFTLRRSIRRKTGEIEMLLQKAEQASRLKSQFLANVSHELRTPMHGILGHQALLLETELDGGQRQHLEIAHKSTKSLLGILNDLLDLSKAEADSIPLVEGVFDPVELCRSILEAQQPAASQNSVLTSFEVSGGVPVPVEGDAKRVGQVVSNLVSNALKFTRNGAVEVVLSAENVAPGRHLLRCSVSDTGVGIGPRDLELVFEPFHQADGTYARNHGGTGLGLAISRRLARMMNGDITAESTPGKGSTFTFTCEVAAHQAAAEESRTEDGAVFHAGRPMRILLAEDNKVNQVLALRMLERDGHSVEVCESGQEAVQLAQTGGFDVVLMDVQMPGMDGLEATRRIRAAGTEGARELPIVAVTAHMMLGEAEKCREAGFSDFLGKPFDIEQLRSLLKAIGSRN